MPLWQDLDSDLIYSITVNSPNPLVTNIFGKDFNRWKLHKLHGAEPLDEKLSVEHLLKNFFFPP
jgi:hypothetical protein